VAALGALPAAGCGGGGSAQADTDDATGDGSGGDDSGGDSVGACGELAPPRVGLQRLTRAEYNRTVRDLFGVTTNPADVFPPDSATAGFDNNAASLTVSPQLAGQLLAAAETVAAEAMANGGPQILVCAPAQDDACARQTLAALALRVYRRPATPDELDDLMALVDFATAEGDGFDAGIEYALQAMLMAPQFLFRSVPPDSMHLLDAGEVRPLDDYALAARLSYFVWGSTPDAALLGRAGEGTLTDPVVLRAEFDRMLADPKSAAIYEGFVLQWLQLGKLGTAAPDPGTFPEFDEALRAEMLEEARLFFEGIRARDGSVLEILTGTQTYANADLAAIYGVSGVSGTALQPIETDPTQRAGILTMPAVLTMNSGPTDPNIVRRGVWLAEAILCAEPPPPPAGVPPAPAPTPGETERERLARHREDPSCASCHNLIDPLGFAFDNYDALGHWRDTADGAPVDNLGQLPDGTEFNGVVALSALLAEGQQYPSCVTEKLMTYALGRTMAAEDECVVSSIGADHVTVDSKLSDLLWAVVTSDAFGSERIEGNG
jgi:hypothetical protein